MGSSPLVFERTYNAPPSVIWRALTDRDELSKWLFDMDGFKPEKDFTFHFSGTSEGVTFVHECIVKEAIPERKLSYSWRYEGYPGESLVTWELFPEGDGTKIVLTHEGLETFPQDNKLFAKNNFNMGWTHFLDTALPDYLSEATS